MLGWKILSQSSAATTSEQSEANMEVQHPIIELVLESPDVGMLERARNYSSELFGPNLFRSNETRNEAFLSPAQFGCFTGLLIILFSNYQIDKDKCWSRLWFLINSSNLREFLFVASCFLVSLLFMPTTLIIFAAFRIYKNIDGIKLRNDKAANFKEYLSGEDIVWACEDAVSKSIINVLAFVGAKSENDGNLPENLLQSIRDRIFTKLMTTNRFPKMFYRRRKSNSGYFYWTDENKLTISDYVRLTNQRDGCKMQSEDEFKSEMSRISNDPLPAGNTALWECLISESAVKVGDDMKIPVSIR